MTYPLPADESARLAALERLAVLDTAAEAAYDDITAVARQVCGTPIALVSLVDRDRQWFKSRPGLEAAETPRDQSFCAHTIARRTLMVVADAAADGRFAANPLVTGPPGIRFYAATPLIDPAGVALGTLCVIDTVPRALAADQLATLAALGRQVTHLLELRATAQELAAARREVRALQALLPVCAWCKRVRDGGRWLGVDQYLRERDGTATTHTICPACTDAVSGPAGDR